MKVYNKANQYFSHTLLGVFEAGVLLYRLIVGIVTHTAQLPFGQSLVQAARDIISNFTPSLILTGALLVLGFQFVSLGFLAMQAQRNFSELYHLIHTSLRKGKQ